jgi:hypothetical protein
MNVQIVALECINQTTSRLFVTAAHLEENKHKKGKTSATRVLWGSIQTHQNQQHVHYAQRVGNKIKMHPSCACPVSQGSTVLKKVLRNVKSV